VYSPLVMEHFTRPRNVGDLEDPDALGEASNPADGDRVRIQLRIRDGRIQDVRMRVMGCVAAIASASVLTEAIKGATPGEALSITRESLAVRLGGLPENKIRCSLTCVDALANALQSGGAAAGSADEDAGRSR